MSGAYLGGSRHRLRGVLMRIRWTVGGALATLSAAITLAVPGTALADGPVLTVLPSTTIDVGNVQPGGASAVVTYTITNTGDMTLHFFGDSFAGVESGASASIDPPCFFTPPPLAPGESCTLHVQLINAPTQPGPFVGATQTFFTNAGDVTITFVGNVVGPNTAEDCKNDGWRDFGIFKNQGDCIAFVVAHGPND